MKLILYGKNDGDELLKLVTFGLSPKYRLHVHSGTRLYTVGKGQEITLIDTQNISELSLDSYVIIFKPQSQLKSISKVSASSNTIAIASSKNASQLEDLAALSLPIISCGMLAKDTLTFSSRTTDSSVISLLRSVATLDGKNIEPFELPLNVPENADDYPLLAYAALCVLLDELDSICMIGNYYK